ncbi:DUF262 domain-containing protein [Amaricoccus sp.]|uniref:DUF262 domain-containing protein n=1 Tax=Amaricoccus sp. TaxID=1872485 RepID=UPI002BC4DD93|nr:DUF262 domain-containing protein [Amaricoccus sp.]HMQ94242.1 DUF262 domain-containing protein [Amaricoccus sp.]
MDADDSTIEKILKYARRFMVPLYQRKYEWDDDRLIPFWEDIEAKAIETLSGDNRFQHYMGALIISPIKAASQFSTTPKYQVVDGQQRLTSFQLFLAALRRVAEERGSTHLAEQIENYLFNPLMKNDDAPAKYKLMPTPHDREVFQDMLEMSYSAIRAKYGAEWWGHSVKKKTQFRSLRAYVVFRHKITRFALYGSVDLTSDDDDLSDETKGETDENDTEEAIAERLEALLTALLHRLKLVVIELGEDDDAQVIFETLNSKGKPLQAMDLVRNNIFHRAEKEEGGSVDELYAKLWDPFDHWWWREPAPNARPTRPRIDHFLSHVLTAETGGMISMRELYAEYRSYAVVKGTPRFAKVEDELKVLQHHAPIYETLEGRKSADPDIAWLGEKLRAWQVTTAYPVAMQLLAPEVLPEDRKQICRLIYSYLVRRALCGLSAKNLNKVFQSIAEVFANGPTTSETLRGFFASRPGSSIKFPSDSDFTQGILEKPAYSLAQGNRIKDILWELEMASRPKFAEASPMPTNLWVEHVLPESWTADWPYEDGSLLQRFSDDPRVIARESLKHSLGNLTLVSTGLNISAGNKGFVEKKSKYEEHASLFMMKWFLKKDKWTENEIRERGQYFAKLAVGIWPGL